MPGYSKAKDLTTLIPAREILQLADDSGSLDETDLEAVFAGTWDTPGQTALSKVVNEAIDQADREIDGHIGLVRSVPVSPVPPLIVNISGQLACWYLHARRSHRENPWDGAARNCRRLLLRIAEGKLSLGPDGTDRPVHPEPLIAVSGGDQIFTRLELSRY